MERGQEVPRGLIITCRDASELFGPAEKVLDQMTSFVQLFVIRSGTLSVLFWWDHGGFSGRFKRLDYPLVGVVGFVREQRFRFHPGHQRVRSGQIVDLAGGQHDLQRITQGVHQNVNFSAQTTFAFPDRLAFSDFFWAPALC